MQPPAQSLSRRLSNVEEQVVGGQRTIECRIDEQRESVVEKDVFHS